MKADIHPEFPVRSIRCACGAVIETRSTKDVAQVDICSSCHPFYTGKQKLVDTAGRVERFRKKYAKRDAAKPAATPQPEAAEASPEEQPTG